MSLLQQPRRCLAQLPLLSVVQHLGSHVLCVTCFTAVGCYNKLNVLKPSGLAILNVGPEAREAKAQTALSSFTSGPVSKEEYGTAA